MPSRVSMHSPNTHLTGLATYRLLHAQVDWSPVNSSVRYRLGSQAVFNPGSNGLPLFKTPVGEMHEAQASLTPVNIQNYSRFGTA